MKLKIPIVAVELADSVDALMQAYHLKQAKDGRHAALRVSARMAANALSTQPKPHKKIVGALEASLEANVHTQYYKHATDDVTETELNHGIALPATQFDRKAYLLMDEERRRSIPGNMAIQSRGTFYKPFTTLLIIREPFPWEATHERWEEEHEHPVRLVHTIFAPGNAPLSSYASALQDIYADQDTHTEIGIIPLLAEANDKEDAARIAQDMGRKNGYTLNFMW